jgi:Protein of unknown function (DUF2946)
MVVPCSRATQSAIMRAVRRNRFVASWVCALALMFAAVAPSISHALAAANAAVPWWAGDVCRSGDNGARRSSLPGQPEAPAKVGKHCDYCSLQGSPPGVPASSSALWPVRSPEPETYRDSAACPPASGHWSPPQSRGPPDNS